jgi:prepilin-type processing-associated H-X9-DG protein
VTGTTLTHALCDYAASNWEGTGVVRRHQPVRLAEITDGTSNTLIAAEKRLNLANLGQASPDDNEGYTAGWDEDTIRRTEVAPRPDFRGSGWDEERRFGSSHSGGINAAFADGSVRFLPYSINATLFGRLGHKSDGQVANLSDI